MEAARARQLRREALEAQIRQLDDEERAQQARQSIQSDYHQYTSPQSQQLSSPVYPTSAHTSLPQPRTEWPNHLRIPTVPKHQPPTNYTPRSESLPQPEAGPSRAREISGSSRSSSLSDPRSLATPPALPYGAVPLPSREQVHDYLVGHQGQQRGLDQEYTINGKRFDVYNLFAQIVKAGGSSKVTRKDWWPIIAVLIGFPQVTTHLPGLRSSPQIGNQVHEFFNRMLRGLEILWDKTQAPVIATSPALAINSMQRPVERMSLGNLLRDEAPQTRVDNQWTGSSFVGSNSFGSTAPVGPFCDSTDCQPTQTYERQSVIDTPTSRAPTSHAPTWATRPIPVSTARPPQSTPARVAEYPTASSVEKPASQPATQSTPQPIDSAAEKPAKPKTPRVRKPKPAPISTPNEAGPSAPPTIPPPTTQPTPSQPGTTPKPTPTLAQQIKSFNHFVLSKVLPLPAPGPGVVVNVNAQDPVTYYALRCHELKKTAMKMRSNNSHHRQMTEQEIAFWNKLVWILDHNRHLTVPSAEDLPSSIPVQSQPPASSKEGEQKDGASTGSTSNPPVMPNQPKKRGPKLGSKNKKKNKDGVVVDSNGNAVSLHTPSSDIATAVTHNSLSSAPSHLTQTATQDPVQQAAATTTSQSVHPNVAPTNIADSNTPAADFLKSLNSNRPTVVFSASKSKPSPKKVSYKKAVTPSPLTLSNSQNVAPGRPPTFPDTPVMVISASPKQRIHLSTGRPSVAHFAGRDLVPTTPSKPTPTPVTPLVPEPVATLPADIPKPKVLRPPVDRASVALPISRRRRATLIARGHYDAFRDDDSDDGIRTRRGHPSLRPNRIARPSGNRPFKPREPEDIPQRFLARPGPAIIEPFKTILQEDKMMKRSGEYECDWKGCDGVMASEWHLRKHVESRRHALQGSDQSYGDEVVYRCFWRGCEEPCFTTAKKLEQHIIARHVSRVLKCPYEDCDLASPNISHLSRHVMKHHADPSDTVRPLADLTERIPPPFPIPDVPLPTAARSDELSTHKVPGSVYRSTFRQEWLRQRIRMNSFAGENPVLHVTHVPHMMEPLEREGSVDVQSSAPPSLVGTFDSGMEVEEDLLGRVLGRKKKRKLELVVEVTVRKRSKLWEGFGA